MKVIPWINILLGLWLVLSPFIFRYTEEVAAFWNAEVIGIMMIIITGVIAFAVPQKGSNQGERRFQRRS